VLIAAGLEHSLRVPRDRAGRDARLRDAVTLVRLRQRLESRGIQQFSAIDLHALKTQFGPRDRADRASDQFVRQHDHRRLILLGQVERPPTRVEHVLHRARRDDQARELALGGVHHEQEIRLLRARRHAGRRTWPLRLIDH